MRDAAWTPVAAGDWTPDIATRGIDIWSVSLDAPADEAARCETLLSPDERARANRFAGARDRRRYIVARANLRRLLGRYAGMAAGAMRFVYGAQGKPALPDADAAGVTFNLSHAGELALIAVTQGRAVGVDVEETRRVDDAPAVARSFFAPGERAALAATPLADRDAAFLRCWTRKEALVKAVGGGLSLRLDDFEVDIAPHNAALLERGDDPAFARDWTLIHLEPGEGHVGAAAIDGRVDEIRCRRLVMAR